jgi:Zn-finger nucleic acid-binding protein
MKCPVCGINLLISERLQVPIDFCPQCRGIWLEQGKLEKLMEQSQSPTNDVGRQFAGDEHHQDDHDKRGRHGKRSLFELFD